MIGFILNFLTFINTLITSILCFLIFLILIFGGFYKRNIHLLLCVNTYLAIFAYSSVSGLFYLDIFLGDIRQKSLIRNARFCLIRGSIIFAFLSSIFGTFCLQALFRLFRLVFKKQKFLTKFPTQIGLISFQWFISIIFVSLIQIICSPNEYYCNQPFNQLKSIVISSIIVFVLPSTVITLSYIRSKRLPIGIQRRTRHDFLIIRRLLIVICIIWIFDIPSMIFFLYESIYRNNIHAIIHRIEWLTRSSLWILLSFYLLWSDSSLKKIFFRKSRLRNDAVINRVHRENLFEPKSTSIIIFF